MFIQLQEAPVSSDMGLLGQTVCVSDLMQNLANLWESSTS